MNHSYHIVTTIVLVLLAREAAQSQWIKSTAFAGGSVECVAAFRDNQGHTTILAATEYAGLYRSTNDGIDWVAPSASLTSRRVSRLVVNGSSVFAYGADGIFSSSNGGDSWDEVSLGLPYRRGVSSLVVSRGSIFAGTTWGCFRSSDNGISWICDSEWSWDYYTHAIAVIGEFLFKATNRKGVFLSIDNGVSWVATNTGLEPPLLSDSPSLVSKLYVVGQRIVAYDGGTIYSKNPSAELWTKGGLPMITTNSLALGDAMLLVGTEEGIFCSSDKGNNWIPVKGGPQSLITSITGIEGKVFAGTKGGGIFRSTDFGMSWTPTNTGLSVSTVLLLAAGEAGMFAEVGGGRMFRTTDDGKSWGQIRNPVEGKNPCWFVSSLINNGPNLVAATDCGVFSSSDQGASWTSINPTMGDPYVSALATSDSRLFVGIGSGVFCSTNNGMSWTTVFKQIPSPYELRVRSLAVEGANLFVGTGKGIFTYVETSGRWVATNSLNLTNEDVVSLAIHGPYVFAGTIGQKGVLMSTDNGSNWTALSGEVGNWTMVNSLASSDTNIFVASNRGFLLPRQMANEWLLQD